MTKTEHNKILNFANFLKKSGVIHKGKYTYELFVYINAKVKGKITCREHGRFLQNPDNHLSGKGCPLCRDKALALRFKSNELDFIMKATKRHGNRYDYSLFTYVNARRKGDIICKKHGKFSQAPNKHLNGCGCPMCNLDKIGDRRRMSLADLIQKFVKIHGRKFGYSLIKEHKNILTKVPIVCKKHGKFWQKPVVHLQGSGCPRCGITLSKSEIEFLALMGVPDTKECRQAYIKPYRVDGLLGNTVYEYLGDYHHGNPLKYAAEQVNELCHATFGLLLQKTMTKLLALKARGYTVKYIWESDWNNFKKGLDASPKVMVV